MDISLAFDFIAKAIEKENDELLFNMFVHDIGNGKTFDEYKKDALSKAAPYKKMKENEIDEILTKAEQIIKRRGDSKSGII